MHARRAAEPRQARARRAAAPSHDRLGGAGPSSRPSTSTRRASARRAIRARRRRRASASSPGGNSWFGIAITRRPAARAARMPLWESSIAGGVRRVDADPPRRLEEHVGRRLAARRPPPTTPRPEHLAPAGGRHHPVDDLACWRTTRARAASAPRSARPPPRRRAAAAAAPRRSRARARRRGRRSRPARAGRRARRARSATTRASSCRASPPSPRRATSRPCSATSALRAAVPGGLRVEQEAVEVEDDGADQAGDQGIEPQSAVLETAIVAIRPVPQDRLAGAIVAVPSVRCANMCSCHGSPATPLIPGARRRRGAARRSLAPAHPRVDALVTALTLHRSDLGMP